MTFKLGGGRVGSSIRREGGLVALLLDIFISRKGTVYLAIKVYLTY